MSPRKVARCLRVAGYMPICAVLPTHAIREVRGIHHAGGTHDTRGAGLYAALYPRGPKGGAMLFFAGYGWSAA